MTKIELSRRRLFGAALAGLSAGIGGFGSRAGAASRPPADEILSKPFAKVWRLGRGVWAVTSTPFTSRDFSTVCNGGIVAGSEGVLVIEGFNTVAGAAWVSDLARELTGRRPTHVVVTHYHGDHVNGLAGLQRGAEPLRVIATEETRALMLERHVKPTPAPEKSSDPLAVGRKFLIPDTVLVQGSEPTRLHLGSRVVTLEPRQGHTPSDVVVRLVDPNVVFTGDLAWTGVFPNYVDALPSKLWTTCDELLRDEETLYVPGHGDLADARGLASYLGVLEVVEMAARDAHAKGTPAVKAWTELEIPPSLGVWLRFREDIYRSAFEAWYRELG